MEKKSHKPSEITLCDKCKGSGEVKHSDNAVLFKHPFAKEPCNVCEGSGRLIKSSVTIETILPFKQ